MLVRHRFWSCVSLAVVACPARSPAAFTSDPTVAADVQRGRKLTDAAAAQLEDAVVRHPDDAAARAQLLGYYFDRSAAFPQRRLAHVVWMIRHRPADPLTPAYGAFSPLADAPGYAAAAAAWDEQVAAHPADAAVLADAADFYDHPGDTGADAAKARDLLGRATAAEPKAFDWPARLAASLERQADREPASAPALCGQALQLRQSAYKLAPTRPDRFHVLLNEPADCYRTGDLIATKRLAQRLLDAADDFPADPAHADAVHAADVALGEVALHSGNKPKADEYLAAAAKDATAKGVPPSPTLAANGPDLGLARELLAAGDRSAVRDYLTAAAPLWPGGRERLNAWVATLDAGGTPDLRR